MFSGGEVKIYPTTCDNKAFATDDAKNQCKALVQACVAKSDDSECTDENIANNSDGIARELLKGDAASKAAEADYDDIVTKLKSVVGGGAATAPADADKPVKPVKPPKDKKSADDEDETDPDELLSTTKTSIDPKACAPYAGPTTSEKREYAECLQVLKTVRKFCDTPPSERGLGKDDTEVEDSLASYQCSEPNKEGRIDSDLRDALMAWEEEGDVYTRAHLLISDKKMSRIIKDKIKVKDLDTSELVGLEVPEGKDPLDFAIAHINAQRPAVKDPLMERFAAALKDTMELPQRSDTFLGIEQENQFKDYSYKISSETGHPVKRVGVLLRGAAGLSLPVGLFSEANESTDNTGDTTVPEEVDCSTGGCGTDGGNRYDEGLTTHEASEWKMGYPLGVDVGGVIRLPMEQLGLILAFGYRDRDLTADKPRTTDLNVKDIHLDIGLAVQVWKGLYLALEVGPGYRWIESTESTKGGKVEEISDAAGQKIDAKEADVDNWTVHGLFSVGFDIAGPLSLGVGLEWTNMFDGVQKKGLNAGDSQLKAKFIPADGEEGNGSLSIMLMPTFTF